jgi:hypothetical protein
LRHRLSNCLIYYQQLRQLADIRIYRLVPQISGNRRLSTDPPSSPFDMKNLYALDPSSTESLANGLGFSRDEDVESDSIKRKETDTEDAPEDVASIHDTDVDSFVDKPSNPSTLLAARCPLCYGGPKSDLRFSR